MSKGDSVEVSVSVDSVTGYEGNVDLSTTTPPENVNVSFSPDSEDVPFGSTMTIYVGSNAPTGTHTITVKGKSEDDATKTARFDLTIE